MSEVYAARYHPLSCESVVFLKLNFGLGLDRNEVVQLKDQLHDFMALAMKWASSTRIAAQTEAKILLTKVETLYSMIAKIESNSLAGQSQIKALQDKTRDLQAQMGLMVPVSEINAAKAESDRFRETIDTLNQKNISLQGEIEKLTCSAQVCSAL